MIRNSFDKMIKGIELFNSVESLFSTNTDHSHRRGIYTAQEIALRVTKSRSSIHKELRKLINRGLLIRELLTVHKGEVVVYIWQGGI